MIGSKVKSGCQPNSTGDISWSLYFLLPTSWRIQTTNSAGLLSLPQGQRTRRISGSCTGSYRIRRLTRTMCRVRKISCSICSKTKTEWLAGSRPVAPRLTTEHPFTQKRGPVLRLPLATRFWSGHDASCCLCQLTSHQTWAREKEQTATTARPNSNAGWIVGKTKAAQSHGPRKSFGQAAKTNLRQPQCMPNPGKLHVTKTA